MIRCVYNVLWMVFLIAVMASCSSTKSLKKVDFIEGMTDSEYIENVMEHAGGWNALTARMSFSLDLSNNKGVTKVNGNLRIKKGEVIQLSVAPFLGIEVARAEISPKGVLVIDRMNKRYVEVSFHELKTLVNADLDFHTLQALFLNELFLPGKGDLTLRDISAFTAESGPSGVTLNVRKGKRFNYSFLTQAPEGLLKESCIAVNKTPYRLNWRYDDFRSLGEKMFPADMEVSIDGGKKPIKATLGLSRLSTNADWETHTEVSSKYERVELADILKLLIK